MQDQFTIIDTFSDVEHTTSLFDTDGIPYGTLPPDDAIREGISMERLPKKGCILPIFRYHLEHSYDEDSIEVRTSSKELQR